MDHSKDNPAGQLSGHSTGHRNITAKFIYAKGTAEELALDQLSQALERKDGFVWVHIHCPTPQKTIYAVPEIPRYIAKVLSASETRPRSDVIPEGLLLNLRCLDPKHTQEPNSMVSLRLWMNERIIVSVHRKPLPFIGKLLTRVHEDILVSNSIDVLRLMLEAIIEDMTNIALDFTEAIDSLEDSDESIREKRRKLSEYRRGIISIRRYLVPQREALLRLPIDKLAWLSDLQRLSLRESADSTTRILEDLETAKDRANLLQEEFLNITQEQINTKIYLLSIVAVIFMPLSFVTGLLGINVGGVPGIGNHLSFWIVCIVLFFIMLIEVLVLRYLKWL